MPAPDDETLRALLRYGTPLNEIAERYGCDIGELLTRVADPLGQNADAASEPAPHDPKVIDMLADLQRRGAQDQAAGLPRDKLSAGRFR